MHLDAAAILIGLAATLSFIQCRFLQLPDSIELTVMGS